MKSNMNLEPSLDKIDDYNGTAAKEKKREINLIILGILFVSVLYNYLINL